MTRCALALLVALALAGCASGGSGRPQAAANKEPVASVSPTPSPAPGTACSVNHRPKVLPRWARSGFSGPKPSVGYVLGDSGNIAAIMFISHHSLSSPPVAGQNNKILWAARVGAAVGRTVANQGRTGGHRADGDTHGRHRSGALDHRSTVARLLVVRSDVGNTPRPPAIGVRLRLMAPRLARVAVAVRPTLDAGDVRSSA